MASLRGSNPPTPPRLASDLVPWSSSPVPNAVNGGLWPAPPAAPSPPTAPPSSSPSHSQNAETAERPRKRVKFSGTNADILSNKLDQHVNSNSQDPLRQSQSQDDGQQIKSILKSSGRHAPPESANSEKQNDVENTDPFEDPKNLSTMLTSTLNELCGKSKAAKIDAYLAIANAFKVHDATGDLRSVAHQLQLIAKCILRDLTEKKDELKSFDTALAQHAIKVLTIFVWTPQVAKLFTNQFCGSVIDLIIGALQPTAKTPKVLTNHYLHIVAYQKFPAQCFTNERLKRLITTLEDISSHVKGNSVIAERLAVYSCLLHQFPDFMAKQIDRWANNMFAAMLSSISEIRTRAIALGTQVGLTLGADSSVSKMILGIFDRKVDPEQELDKLFITPFLERLDEMHKDSSEHEHIPQIWALVVLLFQSPRLKLLDWTHFQAWLGVLQKCFNSNHAPVIYQANLAWNKLVYVVYPDESTAKEMETLLRTPIIGQLERRSRDKTILECQNYAYSSLCNLLYYSFRPNNPTSQTDRYWDAYIVPIFLKVLLPSRRQCNYGCKILSSLLQPEPASGWFNGRANDNSKLIGPSELPSLEPKWVRSRSGRVTNILAVAIRNARWSREGKNDPPVKRLWLNFIQKIHDASAKDIKISKDTIKTMVHILQILRPIWIEGYKNVVPSQGEPDEGQSAFIRKFRALVEPMIKSIDALVFYEGVSDCSVSKSDHVDSQSSSNKRPAILAQLFKIVVHGDTSVLVNKSYEKLLHSIFSVCCDARFSLTMQTDLLRQCVDCLPPCQDDPDHFRAIQAIWDISASKTIQLLKSRLENPSSDRYIDLDNVVQSCVSILKWPSTQPEMGTPQIYESMYDTLVDFVTEFGDQEGLAQKLHLSQLKPLLPGVESAYDDSGDHGSRASPMEPNTLSKLDPPDADVVESASSSLKQGSPGEAIPPRQTATPEPAPVSTPKQPSKRKRPHHEDSQIEFASIDDIPAIAAAFDSQLLTDHQKEVLSRQLEENRNLFRDVHMEADPFTWSPSNGQNSVAQLSRPIDEESITQQQESPTPVSHSSSTLDKLALRTNKRSTDETKELSPSKSQRGDVNVTGDNDAMAGSQTDILQNHEMEEQPTQVPPDLEQRTPRTEAPLTTAKPDILDGLKAAFADLKTENLSILDKQRFRQLLLSELQSSIAEDT